jgi:uncharacterized damage-inducible protein DinB
VIEIEMLRTMVDYHHALYDKLWDSIMLVTDEQFAEPLAYSRGSIRDQMVHVANTDARWLRGLQEDPTARSLRFDPAEYGTRERALALWEEVSAELAAYVSDLDRQAVAHILAGIGAPVWQVLLHVVNHGTDHRAQILRALYDLGVPTFDQDLILYLRAK